MRRFLALLLCLLLMLPTMPVAFADDGDLEPAPAEDPSGGNPPEEIWEPEPEPEPDPPEAPPIVDPEPENGEPEYGVWPAEPEEKEEILPETEDAEEPEEKAVRVLFRCSPVQASVTVYDAQGNLIGAALTGSMLLFPGDYLYEAVCNGYVSQSGAAFTVTVPGADAGAEPEQTVNVILFPAAEEEGFFEEGDAELPLRSTAPEPLVVAAVEPDPGRRTPTVFLQTDSRWAASPYPYSRGEGISILAGSGCGILALTNAVYYLNETFVDPALAAGYSAEAGFHAAGGTRWEFYRGFARTYGETYGVEYAGETDNYTELKNMLLRGCAAICSVPGHIMALVDYDETIDRFLLLDSSPDVLRATDAGYVWISEQELQAMPSRVYDYNGLFPRSILLRPAGLLDVSGLLDGTESDTLGSYGTFDVWVDGEKVANDQADYHAMLPRGASYRIDDIRAKGSHTWYGVQSGALEGSIRSEAPARISLIFGTKDCVSERFAEDGPDPAAALESAPSALCSRWTGGILGPTLSLPPAKP